MSGRSAARRCPSAHGREIVPDVENVASLRLQNSRTNTIAFSLEPYGEEYEMPPGAIFEVVARSLRWPKLEAMIEDGRITVWVGSRSTVNIYENGTEVPESLRGQRPWVPLYPGETE
jgi:hypothetical protein